ncbi:MAG: MOSC domain-containing protein [Nocardioidaceae bacterium]
MLTAPDGGARITRLARYPVKACAPELLEAVKVGAAGLLNDRLLAVVVADRVVTQRELPVLSRIQPRLEDGTGRLRLSLGERTVEDVVALDGPTADVLLFDDPVAVVEQSPVLADWLSEVLGQPARLVGAPETTRRRSPGEVEGLTLLSDEGTLSLHSQASLDRLNEVLAGRGEPPLTADRFRANIVLDGVAAHAEDRIRRFDLGDVVLRFAQVDERCAVTTVDQVVGRRAGPEPLRTLATYRRGEDGGVLFGVYTAVERAGTLRVGDRVLLDGS